MLCILSRKSSSVNSRGLICPIPLQRQQDRPLTSRLWSLTINLLSLESHKFGRRGPKGERPSALRSKPTPPR
jgi:hypothetical protein